METVEQFKNQNVVWSDKFYNYAIHITNGGAMYLYQVDGRLTNESVKNAKVLRLDGVDVNKLYTNIKEANGEETESASDVLTNMKNDFDNFINKYSGGK